MIGHYTQSDMLISIKIQKNKIINKKCVETGHADLTPLSSFIFEKA